jgi:hypothetical protein
MVVKQGNGAWTSEGKHHRKDMIRAGRERSKYY